jgi:formylglycine-generating enzyme required for sulfatase activity
LAGSPLLGDDPNQGYARIYGDEARKVAPKEFAAFALRLIQDSGALKDDPGLAELLLAKAQEFYSRAPGGDDKTKAGEALVERLVAVADAQLAEGKVADAGKTYQQVLKIATANKSPRVGDIQAKVRAVEARLDVDKRLAALLAAVKANPGAPATAKALALLYVLELDTPGEAVPYLQAAGDEALKTYVPLAAKDPESLEEQVLMGLAGWYEGQAGKAGLLGKAVAYNRARSYYELFLVKHVKQDADAIAAKRSIGTIEKELEKLGAAVAGMVRGDKEISLDLGSNVTMKLVLIPAGKFTMGSPNSEKGRKADEVPQHEVTITKAFYMGVYEVTQGQYEAVTGSNPSNFKGAQNPVEQVSWDDAVAFCRKLSEKTRKPVRLPTEAEWEYACRAGTKTAYSFGDEEKALGYYGWFDENAKKQTHPVGQKKPNPAGLYDMHGNVREWCSDRYGEGYYAQGKAVDPQGPDTGSRVLRGGGWYGNPQDCRSAFRSWGSPGGRYTGIGFRVSVDLK